MIQWNDTFVTGHATIDADHRQLVEALNQLEAALKADASKENIGKTLDFLNRYAREHFVREEAYMQKVNCPAYNENCREHTYFIVMLDGWLERLNQGASISLVLEVHREISNWIRNHILKTDCKLRRCKLA